jgi:WD40 repeat protein
MLDFIAKTLPNHSLSQSLKNGQIFTLEMTIDLLIALLRWQIHNGEIDGKVTPDRILIGSEQPIFIQILPVANACADPEFSAPEILDGKSRSSSDLYSIGLIIIYLLTGIRPFQLFDIANHCWAWQDYWHSNLQTPKINCIKLATLLDRSINLDPNLRFNSAQEMMAAVQNCAPNLAPLPPIWTCEHILTGHQGLFAAVKTMAISPHLPIVATGSEDTTIRLWNIDTGVNSEILTGHQKSVESIAFHPRQSGLLCSGDRAGQIKLWQVDPAKELISIDSQQGKVNCLAISPDGKLIVSGGSDKTIRIWHFGLSEKRSIDYLATLKAHQLAVNQIAFNPMDHDVKFASVGSDQQVILWGMENKTPLSICTAHTQAVKALAFSPNGNLLATAGDDGLIIIWNLDNYTLVKTLSAHRWTISALSFLDENTLASASWDGNIKFWQVDLGKEIDCLSAHSAEVLALNVCQSSRCIVTASRDRTAKIWQQSLRLSY